MDRRQRLGRFDAQGDALLFGLHDVGQTGALKQSAGIHGAAVERQFASVGQRECAQIFHQALQVDHFTMHDAVEIGRTLQTPILQALGVAAQDGQRRAQIMRQVSRHLFARLTGLLEIGAHLIERGRQRANFILRAHTDALFELSGSHRLGGRGQLTQRLGQRARQQAAQEQRHQRGHASAGHGGPCNPLQEVGLW